MSTFHVEAGSLLALAYARSEHLVAKSAAVRIEGRCIDSLNLANLRRRVNRTLIVQEVHRTQRSRAKT